MKGSLRKMPENLMGCASYWELRYNKAAAQSVESWGEKRKEPTVLMTSMSSKKKIAHAQGLGGGAQGIRWPLKKFQTHRRRNVEKGEQSLAPTVI